jgi:hypothetical protein
MSMFGFGPVNGVVRPDADLEPRLAVLVERPRHGQAGPAEVAADRGERQAGGLGRVGAQLEALATVEVVPDRARPTTASLPSQTTT